MDQRSISSPIAGREGMVKSASAYADLQEHRPDSAHRKLSPVSAYAPPPSYLQEDDDLIKPKKLVNPVKTSKSHQELHRELLSSCKRGGVQNVEMKPELQKVLESRKRDQLIRQRKQEEEAQRKISPLEAQLLRRHRKLEELERQQELQQQENLRAPEFVKVKENLRRTSFCKDEKEGGEDGDSGSAANSSQSSSGSKYRTGTCGQMLDGELRQLIEEPHTNRLTVG